MIVEKFEPGFYDLVRTKIDGSPHGSGPHTEYHHVVIMVGRHDGSGDDPDAVAERGKEAVAGRLEALGARDIVQAGALSFVTAHVPVDEIPTLSLMGEVYLLGDGELEVYEEPLINRAKATTHSTPRELHAASGIAGLNGSGVLAFIIEPMYHPTAFGDRITKHLRCTSNGCVEDPAWVKRQSSINDYHGVEVARVLGASEFPTHTGIAPGVSFLNMPILNSIGFRTSQAAFLHGLDRAFQEGVDVISRSLA
ncbi:MAG: hypothetical protein MPI93_08325, partial [Nitrosopumilus sp.]|nr:hypothetical protein [Nitrosopumilus sp.]